MAKSDPQISQMYADKTNEKQKQKSGRRVRVSERATTTCEARPEDFVTALKLRFAQNDQPIPFLARL